MQKHKIESKKSPIFSYLDRKISNVFTYVHPLVTHTHTHIHNTLVFLCFVFTKKDELMFFNCSPSQGHHEGPQSLPHLNT